MTNKGASLEKPKAIRNALLILYATIPLAIIGTTINLPKMMQGNPNLSMTNVIVVLGIIYGVIAALIYAIQARKNWARIVYSIMYILGLPFSVITVFTTILDSPLSGVFTLVQILIQAVALALLYKKESTAWFKSGQFGRSPIL